MNKLIEKIIENSINILITLIVSLIVLAGSQILPLILPSILEQIPSKILLTLLTLSILINLILVSFIIYSHFKNKLIPKFGLLWDKNKEAYCPACETLLSEYFAWDSSPEKEYGFMCLKCKQRIYLTHKGKPFSLEEAQKQL